MIRMNQKEMDVFFRIARAYLKEHVLDEVREIHTRTVWSQRYLEYKYNNEVDVNIIPALQGSCIFHFNFVYEEDEVLFNLQYM